MRVPTAADLAARISRIEQTHPWLVAEHGDRLTGFAYASPHRERAGYRWAADVTVYVDPASHRQGIGRALYGCLLDLLYRQGLWIACAGIGLPNDASVSLHESLGFLPVRRLQKHRLQAREMVGRRLVAAFLRQPGEGHPGEPGPPVRLEFKRALRNPACSASSDLASSRAHLVHDARDVSTPSQKACFVRERIHSLWLTSLIVASLVLVVVGLATSAHHDSDSKRQGATALAKVSAPGGPWLGVRRLKSLPSAIQDPAAASVPGGALLLGGINSNQSSVPTIQFVGAKRRRRWGVFRPHFTTLPRQNWDQRSTSSGAASRPPTRRSPPSTQAQGTPRPPASFPSLDPTSPRQPSATPPIWWAASPARRRWRRSSHSTPPRQDKRDKPESPGACPSPSATRQSRRTGAAW